MRDEGLHSTCHRPTVNHGHSCNSTGLHGATEPEGGPHQHHHPYQHKPFPSPPSPPTFFPRMDPALQAWRVALHLLHRRHHAPPAAPKCDRWGGPAVCCARLAPVRHGFGARLPPRNRGHQRWQQRDALLTSAWGRWHTAHALHPHQWPGTPPPPPSPPPRPLVSQVRQVARGHLHLVL